MTLYNDASALLKRYLAEADSEQFLTLLASDETRLTSRITWVEVWRSFGRNLGNEDATRAKDAFRADWAYVDVVEVDAEVAEAAARIADLTGVRSLDAIHLASIQRAGPGGITLVTADLRQAQAARSMGWPVLGT